jgi:hypothetical protein
MQSPDMAIDCKANPQLCPCRSDGDCLKVPNSPRCDVTVGQCVACLPVNDNCVTGSSCRKVNSVWTCQTACAADSDCQKILGATGSCCGAVCIDIAKDVLNCGACGMACGAVSNGQPACIGGACVIGVCNTGWADCDKAPIDGCESQTATDVMNCGGCGMTCMPGANAGASCIGGKCGSACLPGWSDCNNDAKDGCEVNTDGSAANCGGCGKACVPPNHAVGACDSGRCGFRCALNYGDCDGNVANGCETDVTKDTNNCGHCGNICPVRPNAMAAGCAANQCTNVCNKGYGDCDGNLNNGCESDTTKDMANCGGCGMLCSTANTQSATCTGSVCFQICKKGWNDCNMDPTDGCEANFLSDGKNCGACGNVCPMNMPFCVNGACGFSSHNIAQLMVDGDTGPGNGCGDYSEWFTQNLGMMTFDDCEAAANKNGAQYMGQTGYFGNYNAPYQYSTRWVGEADVNNGWLSTGNWSQVQAVNKNQQQNCILAYAGQNKAGMGSFNQAMASANGKQYMVSDFGVISEKTCYMNANAAGARPLNPWMFNDAVKDRAHMVENHICHGSTQYTGLNAYAADGGGNHTYRCFVGYNP